MDFSNVASSTIYMREMKDADQVHALYGTFFKRPFSRTNDFATEF